MSLRDAVRNFMRRRSPRIDREKVCCYSSGDGTKCEKPSRWTPRVFFYPRGYPVEECTPATLDTSFAVCDDHRVDEAVVATFQTDDFARSIRTTFHGRGLEEPDLDNLRVEWLRL